MADLLERLETIAFWLEGRARQHRAEAAAAASIGADKRVYLAVAEDNLARARTVREAINAIRGPAVQEAGTTHQQTPPRTGGQP